MHLAISYQLNQMHSPLPKEAYFNILKHDDAIKYPVQQRAIKQFYFINSLKTVTGNMIINFN